MIHQKLSGLVPIRFSRFVLNSGAAFPYESQFLCLHHEGKADQTDMLTGRDIQFAVSFRLLPHQTQ
jgi:hypothetical protein